ncbi:MAG: hypothetical protein JWM39_580 [Parcubacteria group bacterium]|nr:hypothetical protein [Parcubacteria group bacterium]
MNIKLLAGAALALGLTTAAFGAQASIYDFSWIDTVGGNDSATGQFTLNSSSVITNFTGTQIVGTSTSAIGGTSSFGSADQLFSPTAAEPFDFNGASYHTATLGDFNLAFDPGSGLGLVRISSTETPGGTADGEHSITFSATKVAGGVPEPASWALMILGFGGVGATLRNTKRKTALAATA